MKLLVWGANSHGQLGTGDTDDRLSPTPIAVSPACPDSPAESISAVAGGAAFTVLLTTAGALWGAGANDVAQLGPSAWLETELHRFTRLDGLEAELGSDGEVALSVAAGWAHTLVLSASGRIYATGSNSHGQCGIPAAGSRSASGWVALPDGAVALAVSAGLRHSLALTSDGSVLGWGLGKFFQLGVDPSSLLPPPPPPPPSAPSAAPSTAASSTVAAATARPATGKRPIVAAMAPLVVHPGPIVSVSAGYKTSALVDPAAAVCVRSGKGIGTWSPCSTPSPTRSSGPGWTPVSVHEGWSFTLVSDMDGAVWSSGASKYGQRGVQSPDLEPVTRVALPEPAAAVCVGSEHALALGSESGAVYAWGWGEHGQVGSGSTDDVHAPVCVIPRELLAPTEAVAALGCGPGSSFVSIVTS